MIPPVMAPAAAPRITPAGCPPEMSAPNPAPPAPPTSAPVPALFGAPLGVVHPARNKVDKLMIASRAILRLVLTLTLASAYPPPTQQASTSMGTGSSPHPSPLPLGEGSRTPCGVRRQNEVATALWLPAEPLIVRPACGLLYVRHASKGAPPPSQSGVAARPTRSATALHSSAQVEARQVCRDHHT